MGKFWVSLFFLFLSASVCAFALSLVTQLKHRPKSIDGKPIIPMAEIVIGSFIFGAAWWIILPAQLLWNHMKRKNKNEEQRHRSNSKKRT